MTKEIYKYRDQTIWLFKYLWIDDQAWNKGFKKLKGSTIGTKKTFNEMCQEYQNGYGFSCWNIKKRHATKEEVEEFYKWR